LRTPRRNSQPRSDFRAAKALAVSPLKDLPLARAERGHGRLQLLQPVAPGFRLGCLPLPVKPVWIQQHEPPELASLIDSMTAHHASQPGPEVCCVFDFNGLSADILKRHCHQVLRCIIVSKSPRITENGRAVAKQQ